MKDKVFYEVDPHNRLILKSPKGPSKVKKFRKIVYGRFKIDKKNSLRYHVYKSSGTPIPQKIEFSGKYSLDRKHNLIFTLNKWSNQCQGNRLRLRTKLIDIDGREIVFLISSKRPDGKKSISLMRLYGSWQADKNNRLRFGVKKENDTVDNLTLFSAWKLNKNNEVVYRYGRDSRNIVLKGHWDVKKRYRIRYVLDRKIDSGFNFRSSVGNIVKKGKNTYIKFDVAIDISKKKRVKRNIVFRCRCKLKKDKNIVLELSPGKRELSLKLTKKVLNKKGLLYIEGFLKGKEKYLGGGAAFRW